MVGNGSVEYEHDRDGRSTDLGGCTAHVRNVEYDTFLLIRYMKNRLTVRDILCFFIQPKSNTILLQCRTSSVSYTAMMIHKTWERLHFLDLVMIQIMEVLFRQMLESILQFHLHLHLLLCLSGDDGYWWEARVEGLSGHAWSEAATRVPLRGLVGHWRFIRLGPVKCSFHSILVQQIFKSNLNQGLMG